jgi:hypothetical protein
MNVADWKIISTYTRAEAMEDGVQIAIPEEASKEAGIKFPVFFTQRVYDKYVRVPKGMDHQDENGRLWDILYMFALQARKASSSVLIFEFVCQLPDDGNWTKYESICEGNQLFRLVTLRAEIGPLDIDDPNPSITIMLPDED